MGDGAADPGRVKAVRVGPDRVQALTDFGVVQVGKADAVAVAIGELGVELTLAREVGIDLARMAHVHDQQEGRPAIGAGNEMGITVSLVAGAQHGVVPLARASLPMSGAEFGGFVGQEGKLVRGGLTAFAGALLGLHDKVLGAVEVDKALGLSVGVEEGDGAFKAVVVILGGRMGGLGVGDAKKPGQFDGKLVEVSTFAAARTVPALHKLIDRIQRIFLPGNACASLGASWASVQLLRFWRGLAGEVFERSGVGIMPSSGARSVVIQNGFTRPLAQRGGSMVNFCGARTCGAEGGGASEAAVGWPAV